jgi:hypothetical protein
VELAQGPLVVIALGAAGILLARIARWPIVVALLVIAGFFVEFWLTVWLVGRDTVMSPGWVHWLAPLANDAVETIRSCPPGTPNRPGGTAICGSVLRHDVAGLSWHVVYLVALTVLAAAGALVRARRHMAALIGLIAVLAVASSLAAG